MQPCRFEGPAASNIVSGARSILVTTVIQKRSMCRGLINLSDGDTNLKLPMPAFGPLGRGWLRCIQMCIRHNPPVLPAFYWTERVAC